MQKRLINCCNLCSCYVFIIFVSSISIYLPFVICILIHREESFFLSQILLKLRSYSVRKQEKKMRKFLIIFVVFVTALLFTNGHIQRLPSVSDFKSSNANASVTKRYHRHHTAKKIYSGRSPEPRVFTTENNWDDKIRNSGKK
jgi:hypothetical protein